VEPYSIIGVRSEHRPAWETLYRAYAAFYRVPMTEAILDRLWSWLLDPAHPEEGLVAIDHAGTLVGLAHYRAYAAPLEGCEAGFLDDLYVNPAARGQGVGRRLIEAVGEIARARGWPHLSWMTAADNAQARRVYDGIATATRWVTYEYRGVAKIVAEIGSVEAI
jgi:GNAT superfamily N-acetyltransferase